MKKFLKIYIFSIVVIVLVAITGYFVNDTVKELFNQYKSFVIIGSCVALGLLFAILICRIFYKKVRIEEYEYFKKNLKKNKKINKSRQPEMDVDEFIRVGFKVLDPDLAIQKNLLTPEIHFAEDKLKEEDLFFQTSYKENTLGKKSQEDSQLNIIERIVEVEKPVEVIVERIVEVEKPIEFVPVQKIEVEKSVKDSLFNENKIESEEIKNVDYQKLEKLQFAKLINFKLWEGNVLKISEGWENLFRIESEKQYFKDLIAYIRNEYLSKQVYPDKADIFKCFEYTDFINTKVVIIGKMPFYRKDQADGLSYSTRTGSKVNQTTQIIIQEAIDNLNITADMENGSLAKWAKEGVLLINSVLTAPSDKPAAHKFCGWQILTDEIFKKLNEDNKPKVFVLWGEQAEEKKHFFDNPCHLVLKAPNPSPLSAANGFYGSKPFEKVNLFLVQNGRAPINWNL